MFERFKSHKEQATSATADAVETEQSATARRSLPPTIELATGVLLVAAPDVGPPAPQRTVIYLVRHDEHGSIGVVLNRPGMTPVDELWPQWADLATPPQVLGVGGPAQPDSTLCLAALRHNAQVDGVPGVRRLDRRIALIDLEAAPASIRPLILGLRIFTGYCGWSAGELQRDVDEGAWLIAPALFSDVLSPMHVDLWPHAFDRTNQAFQQVADADPLPPLTSDERQWVLADLDDATECEMALSPRGIRGLMIVCDLCEHPDNEHYHDWDQLRLNLLRLLRDGWVSPYVPPDPLASDSYVSWDYCRGYLDNGFAEIDDDTVISSPDASAAEVDALLCARDLPPESADPLDHHEWLIIREDLAQLELQQAILEPRGILGQVSRCDECQRDHYHPWIALRANMRQLLEHGTVAPHDEPADPDPETYATWDYCRGFIDSITRHFETEQTSHPAAD